MAGTSSCNKTMTQNTLPTQQMTLSGENIINNIIDQHHQKKKKKTFGGISGHWVDSQTNTFGFKIKYTAF